MLKKHAVRAKFPFKRNSIIFFERMDDPNLSACCLSIIRISEYGSNARTISRTASNVQAHWFWPTDQNNHYISCYYIISIIITYSQIYSESECGSKEHLLRQSTILELYGRYVQRMWIVMASVLLRPLSRIHYDRAESLLYLRKCLRRWISINSSLRIE